MIDYKKLISIIFIFNFELFGDSDNFQHVLYDSLTSACLFWVKNTDCCFGSSHKYILCLLQIYVKYTQFLQISIELLKLILMSVLSFGTHVTVVKTKDWRLYVDYM